MQGLTSEALARHEETLGKPDPHARADIVLSRYNKLNSFVEPRSDIQAVLGELTSKKASVVAARKWAMNNWHRADPITQYLRQKLKLACAEGVTPNKNKMGVRLSLLLSFPCNSFLP
jgi:hypothetical protein